MENAKKIFRILKYNKSEQMDVQSMESALMLFCLLVTVSTFHLDFFFYIIITKHAFLLPGLHYSKCQLMVTTVPKIIADANARLSIAFIFWFIYQMLETNRGIGTYFMVPRGCISMTDDLVTLCLYTLSAYQETFSKHTGQNPGCQDTIMIIFFFHVYQDLWLIHLLG